MLTAEEVANGSYRQQQKEIAVLAIVEALRTKGYLVCLLDEAGEILPVTTEQGKS
jgi:hypothetical protein